MKSLHKRVKKLDFWDIQLVKLAVIAFVLLVLKIWPAAMLWVYKTNIWWIFAAFIIFAARPFCKAWVMD